MAVLWVFEVAEMRDLTTSRHVNYIDIERKIVRNRGLKIYVESALCGCASQGLIKSLHKLL